jgi:hypothetical protein
VEVEGPIWAQRTRKDGAPDGRQSLAVGPSASRFARVPDSRGLGFSRRCKAECDEDHFEKRHRSHRGAGRAEKKLSSPRRRRIPSNLVVGGRKYNCLKVGGIPLAKMLFRKYRVVI